MEVSNMEDEMTEEIKEYLRLKKLQEEDNSDELIEEVFNEIMSEENKIDEG